MVTGCCSVARPADDELSLAVQFVEQCDGDDAWQQLAQALLASNEALYVD